MTPNRNWFNEYEEITGCDALLGDDSSTKIIGWGKVWIILKDGRRGTLLAVLHIQGFAWNLISISRMSDAQVHIFFEKYTCKMVWWVTILMRGV